MPTYVAPDIRYCVRTVTSGEVTLSVSQTGGPLAHPTTSMISDASYGPREMTYEPVVFTGAAELSYLPLTVTWSEGALYTRSLTPSPPDIPYSSFIPTWVPGTNATVLPGGRPAQPPSTRLATGILSASIAVPILVFLAILGCCVCCFRARRRKEKLAMAKERDDAEAAEADIASRQAAENGGTTANAPEEPERGAGSVDRQSEAQSPGAAGEALQQTRSSSSQAPLVQEQSPVAGPSTSSQLPPMRKPVYPGLPSHEFDGIEEPPPYAEAPPGYTSRITPISSIPQRVPVPSRQSESLPSSPTQEETTQPVSTQHESDNTRNHQVDQQ